MQPTIVSAAPVDCLLIQKLWPFYVYDLGRECSTIRSWEWPTDPSFVADDITPFFGDPDKKAFFIKIEKEIAGFILIQKIEIMPDVDFFISDFFIIAKFQNQGIGKLVAIDIFNQLQGKWALGVISANKKALYFWKKTLNTYTDGHFSECLKTSDELKTAQHPNPHPMILFTFDSTSTAKL